VLGKLTVAKLLETMGCGLALLHDQLSKPKSSGHEHSLPAADHLLFPSTANASNFKTTQQRYEMYKRKMQRVREHEHRKKAAQGAGSEDPLVSVARVVENLIGMPAGALLKDAANADVKLTHFGVDSLSSMQLSNKLETLFSIKVSQMQILSGGVTLRQLADRIRGSSDSSVAP
jgi:acyl carrier protein